MPISSSGAIRRSRISKSQAAFCKDNVDGPRAAPELRILRPRPATSVAAGAHLYLRMHVLRRLCRQQARKRLPQLRRRFRTAPDPSSERMATRPVAREKTTVNRADSPLLSRRGDRGVLATPAAHAAGPTLVSRIRSHIIQPARDKRRVAGSATSSRSEPTSGNDKRPAWQASCLPATTPYYPPRKNHRV